MLVNNMHDPAYARVAPYTYVLATRPRPRPTPPSGGGSGSDWGDSD